MLNTIRIRAEQLAETLPTLSQKQFTVLLKPCTFVPGRVQEMGLKKAIEHVFKEAIDDGDLDFLTGRNVNISVSDLNLNWTITRSASGVLVNTKSTSHDVSITGQSGEFLALVSGKEDPDTLFFQRRIIIEGDTELGLEMKNLLGGFDIDELPKLVNWGTDFLARKVAC